LKSTLYFFAFFALFAIGLPHYGRYMSLIFQLASCLTFGVHYTLPLNPPNILCVTTGLDSICSTPIGFSAPSNVSTWMTSFRGPESDWHPCSELSTAMVVVSGQKALWTKAQRFTLTWTAF
jgi:hypothetical protein